jgi:hypothetical protein
MMGFVALPSLSSFKTAGNADSLPALRQVACRAKQARPGANDAVVETVQTEEMEEAREERIRSEIIDSGLERDDAVSADGRRGGGQKRSIPGKDPG